MIQKIILNPDEELPPAIIEWKEGIRDYVVEVPKGITRFDLIELVEEIKRLTEVEED